MCKLEIKSEFSVTLRLNRRRLDGMMGSMALVLVIKIFITNSRYAASNVVCFDVLFVRVYNCINATY